jgi:hypothetical protein
VDAGADASDGSVTDAGIAALECPADLEDEALGVTGQLNQQVIISRVVFTGGGNADVTFRAVGADFNFASPMVLCTGSAGGDCDDGVQDLVANADGGAPVFLEEDEEVTFPTSGVNPAGGELALVNSPPTTDPADFIFAYIAWGTFTSVGPGVDPSLEARAVTDGFWTSGERVEVGQNDTIYVLGDVNDNASEEGFAVCASEE